MRYILVGILIGFILNNVVSFFGEARYSEAIKKCIIEYGPNK